MKKFLVAISIIFIVASTAFAYMSIPKKEIIPSEMRTLINSNYCISYSIYSGVFFICGIGCFLTSTIKRKECNK